MTATTPYLTNEVTARKRLSLHAKAQQNSKSFLVTFFQKSDMA